MPTGDSQLLQTGWLRDSSNIWGGDHRDSDKISSLEKGCGRLIKTH